MIELSTSDQKEEAVIAAAVLDEPVSSCVVLDVSSSISIRSFLVGASADGKVGVNEVLVAAVTVAVVLVMVTLPLVDGLPLEVDVDGRPLEEDDDVDGLPVYHVLESVGVYHAG